MDQFTRRIVGFAVQGSDRAALCQMFNRAIRGQTRPAQHRQRSLVSIPQWQATLRVLEVTEIKTVPYVPLSHPFVERLIGTLRRECLDRTSWIATDLAGKLLDFQDYYNEHRTHTGRQRRSLTGKSQLLSLAEALSRLVPNADCRVILVIRYRQDRIDKRWPDAAR